MGPLDFCDPLLVDMLQCCANFGSSHLTILSFLVDKIIFPSAIAAKRSDVKTIIFPSANKRDFDELAENVKEGLDVHFVDEYNQIFDVAFVDDQNTGK